MSAVAGDTSVARSDFGSVKGGNNGLAPAYVGGISSSVEGAALPSVRATDSTFRLREDLPIRSVIPIPVRPPESRERFELLQQFLCIVLHAESDCFTARLEDRTDPDRETEIGEFEFDDVSEFDRELVVVGAAFYWSIGYRVLAGGQRTRVSQLRFRRLPAWSRADLAAAAETADTWSHLLTDAE